MSLWEGGALWNSLFLLLPPQNPSIPKLRGRAWRQCKGDTLSDLSMSSLFLPHCKHAADAHNREDEGVVNTINSNKWNAETKNNYAANHSQRKHMVELGRLFVCQSRGSVFPLDVFIATILCLFHNVTMWLHRPSLYSFLLSHSLCLRHCNYIWSKIDWFTSYGKVSKSETRHLRDRLSPHYCHIWQLIHHSIKDWLQHDRLQRCP